MCAGAAGSSVWRGDALSCGSSRNFPLAGGGWGGAGRSKNTCFETVSYSNVSAARLCPTLCDPVVCSPPGSSVHGILQARTLEWADIPSPGDLPDSGIESGSPALQADSLPAEPLGKSRLMGGGQYFCFGAVLADGDLQVLLKTQGVQLS